MDPLNIDQTRLPKLRLVGLGALLVITGFGLASVAGPPRPPDSPPSPESVVRVLAGATLPIDVVLLVLVDAAWLLWGWIALSLLLELVLVATELAAEGSARVRSLRRVIDRLSPPLVRRGVAAAFAVQVISRGVPIAAAQPLPPAVESVQPISPNSVDAAPEGADDRVSGEPTYLVRSGDTLWSIAERAYGSGAEYRRLVAANRGRTMSDGQVFSARGVIQPGWRLLAPGATWSPQIADSAATYIVQDGDTLSSIADSVLGDPLRWNELFALNAGVVSADGRHTLVDPNTIWPGLRLRLPDRVEVDTPPDASPPDAPEPVQLLAASAPAPSADPDPPSESPKLAAMVELHAAPVPSPTALPLVRTQHAYQPVVLEPADQPAQPPEPTDPPAQDLAPDSAVAASDVNPDVSLGVGPVGAPAVSFALGGLGLAGLAGLALGARRLRRLRPLPTQPESEVVVQGGFAEAQLAHEFTRGLHGVGADSAVTLVARLEAFLSEYRLSGVQVVSVRDGRSSTTIALRCALAQQPVLVDLAPIFAQQLDADIEACVSTDQDVLYRLSRMRKTRLLPTADMAAENPVGLLALGLLYDRQVFSASWSVLGHVLVASLPGHGSETILTSLVATATARRSPEQLRVWCIAPSRALPSPLFDLPHLDRVVDPTDAEALGSAMAELRAEVDSREPGDSKPDLMVVVTELSTLGEHTARLALLANRAAEVGVRLVVASSNPEAALEDALTPCLTTRMVLRMQTEEASVGLLGVADAAFLSGGGRLLLRLDGREPVELYGYQVLPEHLERLIKVMHTAYPTPSGRTAALPRVPIASSSPVSTPPAPTAADEDQADPPRSDQAEADRDSPAEVADSSCLEERTSMEPAPPGEPAATAPIQIFCFGSPHIECGGRTVWPRGGGDAKPWELMLYLASQPAEGVSREAAFQAIWPDDEVVEDAGHRFRQLRYRLRRQLQAVPEAPPSDGVCFDRRQLKFDPGIVYSDAQEFLEHVRAVRVNPAADAVERLERARTLYVGDLLEGPDARRYAWLDERGDSGVTLREHFRRLFQNASIRLAELYTAENALDQAIDLYRELTDIDPVDERLWLGLFRIHAQRNDRQALVDEESRLRQTLRDLAEEMDIAGQPHVDEPSPETSAEYRRLLASIPEREPVAV